MRKSGFVICPAIDYQGQRRYLVWGKFDVFAQIKGNGKKGGDTVSETQKWTKLPDEF